MRAARVDNSQQGIVDALRAIGADVVVIGKPVDLLVGYEKRCYLIECKSPGTYYKGTKVQQDFIRDWRGQVRICRTGAEAVKLVTEAYR